MIEYPPHVVIERLDHGRIGWGILGILRIHFAFVGFNVVGFCIEWAVYGKLPVVDKERFFILRTFFEVGINLICHPVFNVFARISLLEIREFPRCHIATRRSGTIPIGDVDIEAMIQSSERAPSQVPFSKVSGMIANLLKSFGKIRILCIQTVRLYESEEFMVGWRILFETGAKDRFASYVTGWCGQSRSRRMKARK